MKIKNITRNRFIARNAVLCESVLSKSVGLMFSKNMGKCLVFKFNSEKIVPLHMFFVFYPIDVLFLDKKKVVVELKENFLPFTLYTPKKKLIYVVELPNGIVKKSKTGIGDKIRF